jgi:hypothetical protein
MYYQYTRICADFQPCFVVTLYRFVHPGAAIQSPIEENLQKSYVAFQGKL